MDISAVSQLITTVGFPIFVAVWMLYKNSKDNQQMRDIIYDLKLAIERLTHNISISKENNDEKENSK